MTALLTLLNSLLPKHPILKALLTLAAFFVVGLGYGLANRIHLPGESPPHALVSPSTPTIGRNSPQPQAGPSSPQELPIEAASQPRAIPFERVTEYRVVTSNIVVVTTNVITNIVTVTNQVTNFVAQAPALVPPSEHHSEPPSIDFPTGNTTPIAGIPTPTNDRASSGQLQPAARHEPDGRATNDTGSSAVAGVAEAPLKLVESIGSEIEGTGIQGLKQLGGTVRSIGHTATKVVALPFRLLGFPE